MSTGVGAGPSVLGVGAGIVGRAIAFYLVRGRARVRLIDADPSPADASHASLGVLTHSNGGDNPYGSFHRDGHALHGELAAQLLEETGLDVGFQRLGGIQLVLAEGEIDQAWELMAFNRERGGSCEWVDAQSLRRLEPRICESALGGVFFPDDYRVDPELLATALLQSAQSGGLQVDFGTRLTGFDSIGDREVGVRLLPRSGTESCGFDLVVLAAGSWSAQLGELAGVSPRIRPVRGQHCRFGGGREIHHVLRYDGYCAVPSRDKITAGATLEDVGFATDTTPAAATEITGFFRRILQLSSAVTDQRAGLRPKPRRGRPVIGPLRDGVESIFVATGHYKSGVLLGPITGQVVAEWLLTGVAPRQMSPFTVAR